MWVVIVHPSDAVMLSSAHNSRIFAVNCQELPAILSKSFHYMLEARLRISLQLSEGLIIFVHLLSHGLLVDSHD
jgi:hypothetical protein